MKIRNFSAITDYNTMCEWYIKLDQIPPYMDMIPADTTFVIENEGKPAAFLTLYVTNAKGMSYFENAIRDPKLTKELGNALFSKLVSYGLEFARTLGYKRILCYAPNQKLKKRYSDLGFKSTLNELSSLVKELD